MAGRLQKFPWPSSNFKINRMGTVQLDREMNALSDHNQTVNTGGLVKIQRGIWKLVKIDKSCCTLLLIWSVPCQLLPLLTSYWTESWVLRHPSAHWYLLLLRFHHHHRPQENPRRESGRCELSTQCVLHGFFRFDHLLTRSFIDPVNLCSRDGCFLCLVFSVNWITYISEYRLAFLTTSLRLLIEWTDVRGS